MNKYKKYYLGEHMEDLYAKLYEIGTPASDADFFPGKQEGSDTCAIRAQQQILSMFGIERSESDLVADATSHGEYGQGTKGTELSDLGNLLVREGIEIHRFYGATPAHLIAELAQGHKIMVALDSGEIWADHFLTRLKETVEDWLGFENADHAVVVTGIDPHTYEVTISDPGDGSSMKTISASTFFHAFKDSDYYMVSTASAPKDFILTSSAFDGREERGTNLCYHMTEEEISRFAPVLHSIKMPD